MHDGKSGCRPSERKRKVGERGLYIRRTSATMGLNRDKITYIRRLSGSEDFEHEKKNFVVYALLNFKPV